MIPIKPIREDNTDCFKCIILSIAQHYGKACDLMRLNSWGFRYEKDGYLDIRENFSAFIDRRGERYFTALEKLHGIVIERMEIDAVGQERHEGIVEFVKTEIQAGFPTVLRMDGYYFPLTPLYQKYHVDHCLLILDFDLMHTEITYLDPFFFDDVKKINLIDVSSFVDCVYRIRLPEEYDVESACSSENIALVLKEHLEKVLAISPSAFEMMHIFGDEFFTMDLDGLFQGVKMDKLQFHPFIIRLTEIEDARVMFLETLHLLKEKYDLDLTVVFEKIEHSASVWRKIKYLVVKGIITKSFSDMLREKIANQVYVAAVYEEKLVREMISMLGGRYGDS